MSAPAGHTRTILLAGATGMVGGLALRRLLSHPAFDQVVALVRRPLPGPAHIRLRAELVDLTRLSARPPPAAIAACSALGTTLRKAGSREAFRAIDHDAVLDFARWALAGGVQTFVHVSSVGADPTSRNFYLRVKGEIEQAVSALPFHRVVALRPSLLLGARGERRLGEALARVVMPALNPLLRGRVRPYRAIPADTVAAALVAGAVAAEPGRLVWHHDEICAAASAV